MENRFLRRRSMRHMQDGRRDMRGMRDRRDYRRADTPAGGMYGRGMGRGRYYPESSSDMSRGYDRYSGYSDGYFGAERYRQPRGDMANDMHIMGDYRRDYNDYNDYRDYRDYNDYNDYSDYDYAKEDEHYHKDLEEWIQKMKRNDRFGWSKQQVLDSAKQMGVKFDEFDETEFYAIYLAMVTDYKSLGNEPRIYLTLAKEWLMDDDVAMKGSEKVCAYLYSVVKGEM